MYGIILGDIAGSIYEFKNIDKSKKDTFILFDDKNFYTDDTLLTLATIKSLNHFTNITQFKSSLITAFHDVYDEEPYLSWGNNFKRWAEQKQRLPYNSKGNGAGFRSIPAAYVAKNLNQVKKLSQAITSITHNHPLGIKYAEATAVAAFLALTTKNKDLISETLERDYFKIPKLEDLNDYQYSELIENCVPQAIACFMEGTNFEQTLRNAIAIGGDSDTIAAIAGGIAEAYYGTTNAYFSIIEDYFPNEKHHKLLVELSIFYRNFATRK